MEVIFKMKYINIVDDHLMYLYYTSISIYCTVHRHVQVLSAWSDKIENTVLYISMLLPPIEYFHNFMSPPVDYCKN